MSVHKTTMILGNHLKKTKAYSVTEIRAMTNILFENAKIIQDGAGTVPQEIFVKMVKSIEGKRTVAQMKLWYYDLKKIREHESRFTVVVQRTLSAWEQKRLHNVMFPRGLTVGDCLDKMKLKEEMECDEKEEEREEEKENSMDGVLELDTQRQEALRQAQQSGQQ